MILQTPDALLKAIETYTNPPPQQILLLTLHFLAHMFPRLLHFQALGAAKCA